MTVIDNTEHDLTVCNHKNDSPLDVLNTLVCDPCFSLVYDVTVINHAVSSVCTKNPDRVHTTYRRL